MIFDSLLGFSFFVSSSICSKFSFEVFSGDRYLSISGFHFSVGAVWSPPGAASSILDSDFSLLLFLTNKS